MKVVTINGSARARGNTSYALDTVSEVLREKGIETQRIDIGTKALHGCIGCGVCFQKQNMRCRFDDDPVNDWIQIMSGADGLVIGSPVYYAGVNGALKSFLDRAFFVGGANGGVFRHKVGAAVLAVRRAGSLPAFDQINKYFSISEMITPGSNYWNHVFGREPGEAAQDLEGVQSMRVLAENIAWLLQLVEHGKTAVPAPARQDKIMMSFIR